MSALLTEVADILREHGSARCQLGVEEDGKRLVLRVEIEQVGLGAAALQHDLQYLAGLAQARSFADLYGIDAAAFEKVLRRREPL